MTTGTWTPIITCATPGTLSIGYGGGGVQTGLWDLDANGIITLHFTLYPTSITLGTASGVLYITGIPYEVNQPINSIGTLNYRGLNKTGFTQFNVATRLASGIDKLVMRCNAQASGDALINITDLSTSAGSIDLCGVIRYKAGNALP